MFGISGIVEMKIHLGVLFLVLSCSSQEYDLEDDYSNHVDSIEDSDDATEVYNITFEHKPERVVRFLNNNDIESVDDVLKERRSKSTAMLEPHVKTTEQTTTEHTPAPTIRTTTYSHNSSETVEEETESDKEEPTASYTVKPKASLPKYPYAVSLQKKGSHYASGALVSKSWVLTSAGDFYNVRESIKLYRVRLGSVDCKESGEVVPLKRIEIHPSYVAGRPSYDVALVGLARAAAPSDAVKPIEFTTNADHVLSAKFTSTYWPRIVVKGKPRPSAAKERERFTSMRVSTQPLMPWHRCARQLDEQGVVLSEASLCLVPVQLHHSDCSPDAGAPVVSDDGLWGITSGWVGKSCSSTAPSPTVVTRTSAPRVRSWLTTTLNS